MSKNAGNLIFEVEFLKIFWGWHVGGTCSQALLAPSMPMVQISPFFTWISSFQSPSTSLPKSGLAVDLFRSVFM